MRWAALADEAARNVRSGTAVTVQLMVLLGLLCAGTVLAGGLELRSLTDAAQHYRDAGAAVLILRADGRVDPAACEALGGTPGVTAGALRRAPSDIVAAALPGSSIPTYEVSAGLAALLGESAGEGVLVSRAVADALGTGALATTTGQLGVTGVYEYPDDGRRADLGFAILVPTVSSEPFDECWAQTWPETPALESLLRTAVLPGEGSELLQLNGSLGEAFDGQQRFDGRVTRWLPAVAALVGAAIALAAGRLRRIEFASARHAGVALADLWLLVMVESLRWVAAVAAVSVPLTVALARGAPPGDVPAYVQLGVGIPALIVAGGLSGATIAVLTSGESALFRLVKERR